MKVGAMNHPRRDLFEEIAWMADLGLDFIDLTLEPPASASWRIDPEAVRRELEERGLGAVGHTAYYLPLGSPFEEVRLGAVAELRRCLETFGRIGVEWMNVHPDRQPPMHDRRFCIERNLESLRELAEASDRTGVGIMLENLPEGFNTAAELGELLDPIPELGLHLDIGHSNLRVETNTSAEVLAAYGDRLKHVHLHDNRGGTADLHLPLGAGEIDVVEQVLRLKRADYDDTIALEVFTPDRHYFDYSVQVLRETWDRVQV
jgi:sugar phosphate isomerase/epimerase